MLNFGRNCIFFSPHLDDAVLSCGGLLVALTKYRHRVSVISIFTKAQVVNNYYFAKKYLKSCGLAEVTPSTFFSIRRAEDKQAMDFMDLRYQHWSFSDALWRKGILSSTPATFLPRLRPNKNILYPTKRSLFSGKIKSEDKKTVNELKDRCDLLLKDFSPRETTLLSPLGIGGHVDHIMVRKVVRSLGYQTYFWEDFPYNLKHKVSRTELRRLKLSKCLEFYDYKKKKRRAISCYKSQLKSLFGSKPIPLVKEVLYCEKK